MVDTSRKLAVFDFDGTLVEGDSMWPFLTYAFGWPRVGLAIVKAVAVFVFHTVMHNSPELKDQRSFMKAFILHDLLAGQNVAGLAPAITKLRQWARWKDDIRQKLVEHAAEGCEIVIASGGLGLYLPTLLDGVVKNYTLICTDIEIIDGSLTGCMTGGNCVRDVKAKRVAGYIAANGPYAESWGYGNTPHDLPMLALVKNRIVI